VRLTKESIEEQGGKAWMKAWIAGMNAELGDGPEPTEFTLNQLGTYPVRQRLGPRTPSRAVKVDLLHGARFKLTSVYEEADVHRACATLMAQFHPTSAELKEDNIVSMTLPMEEALAVMEGLPAWLARHIKGATAIVERTESQRPVPVPKEEAFRESEEWGAW
jgi:hypothetical protein